MSFEKLKSLKLNIDKIKSKDTTSLIKTSKLIK